MAKRLTMAEIDAIITLHTTRHFTGEDRPLVGGEPGDGRQVRCPGRGREPAKLAHRDRRCAGVGGRQRF